MPDVVLKHKNPKILPYVLSVPAGNDVDEYVKAWCSAIGDGGWSLDKKTDPAEVPEPPQTPAADAANTKEK